MVAQRVGVEHRREAVVVDRGAEQRQYLAVAFERMNLDQRPPVGQLAVAGVPQELGDAWPGVNVAEALQGHVPRLEGEKTVEQAVDLLGGARLQVAIAGQRLQLALLAAQARARRGADRRIARLGADEAVARADVDRRLVRQQRERVGNAVPAQRLAAEHREVDAARGDLVEDAAELGCGDVCKQVAPPKAEIEVRMFGTEELYGPQWTKSRATERPEQHGLAGAVEAGDDERRDGATRAHMLLPGG